MEATLLIDTYDTVEGARRAARVALSLRERGGRLHGVRLDSGDLRDLSVRVRAVLDEAGLHDVAIFESGNLDEHEIARLVAAGAPIDAFGVGSRLGTSADAPYLDMAYKLVALEGRPVLKLSAGKATMPCSKQVWRRYVDGRPGGDVITLASEPLPQPGAEPLLVPVMKGGCRIHSEGLEEARRRHAEQREGLAPELLAPDAEIYPVESSDQLVRVRERTATSMGGR